jgi:hypothetical protein
MKAIIVASGTLVLDRLRARQVDTGRLLDSLKLFPERPLVVRSGEYECREPCHSTH